MKTIEDLNNSIKKGEIKTNFISRFLEKNQEIKEIIFLKSINIEKYYRNPNILQRLKFIIDKEVIELCTCGDPLSWRNFTKGYNKTCGSKKCSTIKNIESVKKYYTEKYGVDHLFKTDKFKNNIKNTFKEKYGVDNPFKSKEIKDKIKETNLLKFGETNWLKVPENREKISNKIIENNKIIREEKILNNKIPIEIIEYLKNQKVIINCNKCNNKSEFSISFFNKKIKIQENPCLTCNPLLRSVSKGEIELFNFIESIYKGNIIKNDRKILEGKEIDIYLPDLMMAFEFNGIYYHSEIFKEKKDCLSKKKLLSDKSINLIVVWEDDWEQKKEIIKSRIKSLLNQNNRIYARKCKIMEISGSVEKKFLIDNHIQGYVPSSIKIGLYYNSELVSIMSFGSYRKSLGKNKIIGEYELLRFCNKLGINVIGGASKIFKYFINKYLPNKVLSYQNNSWNTGNLYEKMGFTKKNITDPNYYWAKGNLRFNRFNFRKDKLIKEGYDPNKSESEIMYERGYYRIWDMGNIKWEYEKPSV
jgi:hypothetical protein